MLPLGRLRSMIAAWAARVLKPSRQTHAAMQRLRHRLRHQSSGPVRPNFRAHSGAIDRPALFPKPWPGAHILDRHLRFADPDQSMGPAIAPGLLTGPGQHAVETVWPKIRDFLLAGVRLLPSRGQDYCERLPRKQRPGQKVVRRVPRAPVPEITDPLFVRARRGAGALSFLRAPGGRQ